MKPFNTLLLLLHDNVETEKVALEKLAPNGQTSIGLSTKFDTSKFDNKLISPAKIMWDFFHLN